VLVVAILTVHLKYGIDPEPLRNRACLPGWS
jgi:hypothetical protein